MHKNKYGGTCLNENKRQILVYAANRINKNWPSGPLDCIVNYKL